MRIAVGAHHALAQLVQRDRLYARAHRVVVLGLPVELLQRYFVTVLHTVYTACKERHARIGGILVHQPELYLARQ